MISYRAAPGRRGWGLGGLKAASSTGRFCGGFSGSAVDLAVWQGVVQELAG